MMQSLFPQEPIYPNGFSYIPDFLTLKEETTLVDLISKISLHTFIFQGYEAKRKVASFGYDYSFEKRTLTKGQEVPEEFRWLIDKVNIQLASKNDFAELLVTEYPAGSVINWHRDAPPFDIIVGISLLTDCTFRFRPHEKTQQTRKSIISIPLQRRSLYVMQAEARSDWQHSILPVTSLRYSITLRTLRK
jgi:alkylated DNA repair dioxygenase AlkB